MAANWTTGGVYPKTRRESGTPSHLDFGTQPLFQTVWAWCKKAKAAPMVMWIRAETTPSSRYTIMPALLRTAGLWLEKAPCTIFRAMLKREWQAPPVSTVSLHAQPAGRWPDPARGPGRQLLGPVFDN